MWVLFDFFGLLFDFFVFLNVFDYEYDVIFINTQAAQ